MYHSVRKDAITTEKLRDGLQETVLRLKDLDGYPDGAVASRMIAGKKTGSVTLFSFDEDEGLSDHTAPYDAVVTILDGGCEVRAGGQTFPMKEGETIIIPANKPHALSATKQSRMMLVMIGE